MGNPDKDKLPVSSSDAGHRLDIWLHARIPAHSRARWQELIKSGRVRVNGAERKTRYLLREGDVIEFEIPPPRPVELVPEDKPLDILYEDTDLLVLNKPPGLVVHPAPGHNDGTLVNALLFHCRDLAGIGGELRPGIVHRLDKDTSGLMVVARNRAAMDALVRMIAAREVSRQYLALAWGRWAGAAQRVVQAPIGRDPRNRLRMATVDLQQHPGKPARTDFELLVGNDEVCLVRCTLHTGRTHQIRVHMASLGHALVGDATYGGKPELGLQRQALHAHRLALLHPVTAQPLQFECALPPDLAQAVENAGLHYNIDHLWQVQAT